jgi:nucleoid DNA-binding protein
MTKRDIVRTISEQLGLSQMQTREVVQRTFEEIVNTLAREGRIELRNFGVFEVIRRKRRKARNPRTGDPVEVPERFSVRFKPGKEMTNRIRSLQRRLSAQPFKQG